MRVPRAAMPRYRLSQLLLAVGAVAVVLGLWSTFGEPYRHEIRALRQLESLGGIADIDSGEGLLDYDHVVAVGLDLKCNLAPHALDFLADLPELRNLDLGGTAATDETMSTVGRLTGLTQLHLRKTGISDTGLRRLSSLNLEYLTLEGCHSIDGWAFREFRNPESLQHLDLSQTGMNDQSVAGLARFLRLEQLSLGRTQITDAALVHLSGLTRLTSLDLGPTRITGTGFRHLGALRLHVLSLEESHINDAGVREIAQLPGLVEVRLDYTRISDAGIEELTKMESLERLSLEGTSITDAGLLRLTRCKNLRTVKCDATSVTEGGVRLLNKSGIEVVSDWGVLHARPREGQELRRIKGVRNRYCGC